MRPIISAIALAVYILAWPFWMVYFRLYSRRSRVLVVAGGDILLIKSWLGTGEWGLPGGGAHRGESLESSAVRELYEEVGIKAAESALTPKGSRINHKPGFSYTSVFFILELTERPQIKLQRFEIADAKWVSPKETARLKMDLDTRHALRQYRTPGRSGLL